MSSEGCRAAAAVAAASQAAGPANDASPCYHWTLAEAGSPATARRRGRCHLAGAVAAPTGTEVHCSEATEAATGTPGLRDHSWRAAAGAAKQEGRRTCASRRPGRTACRPPQRSAAPAPRVHRRSPTAVGSGHADCTVSFIGLPSGIDVSSHLQGIEAGLQERNCTPTRLVPLLLRAEHLLRHRRAGIVAVLRHQTLPLRLTVVMLPAGRGGRIPPASAPGIVRHEGTTGASWFARLRFHAGSFFIVGCTGTHQKRARAARPVRAGLIKSRQRIKLPIVGGCGSATWRGSLLTTVLHLR